MAEVICHSCKGSYHRTTSKYDYPNKPLTGDMLEAKELCHIQRWWTFPETAATKSGEIECPNCGSLYLLNGRINLVGDIEPKPKRKSIPPEMNDTILELAEEGKTATVIANLIDSSPQAVGRRLYDLKGMNR